MQKDVMRPILLCFLALAAFSGPVARGEMFRLGKDQSWESVEATGEGAFVVGVSQLKRAIEEGDYDRAEQIIAQLKTEHPQLAGDDLEAFMKAERFYARRNFEDAIKAYDKFLDEYPESWLYESALERKYAMANRFLNGEKRRVLGFVYLPAYEEGVKMMREIADRAGPSPIGYKALVTLAESQRRKGKFLDEYETWASISDRWPTGDQGREAQLGMAYSLHSAYKGPRFDSASLSAARTYYENIEERYPHLKEDYAIEGKIDMVNEQRAYKEYHVGQYYERTENFEAARITYASVVGRWPGTTGARLSQKRLEAISVEDPTSLVERDVYRKAFDYSVFFLDEWIGKIDLSGVLK